MNFSKHHKPAMMLLDLEHFEMTYFKQLIMTASITAMMAVSAQAQEAGVTATDAEVENEIDCDDEDNQAEPICLGLPGNDITNLVPLVAPALGAIAAAALGGGGGANGTVSTVSTTSTTSTTN